MALFAFIDAKALCVRLGSGFKFRNVPSNKHFSFSIPARQERRRLHLFESAIDLLSYGTLELFFLQGPAAGNYFSFAGIYKPKKVLKESAHKKLKGCKEIVD